MSDHHIRYAIILPLQGGAETGWVTYSSEVQTGRNLEITYDQSGEPIAVKLIERKQNAQTL